MRGFLVQRFHCLLAVVTDWRALVDYIFLSQALATQPQYFLAPAESLELTGPPGTPSCMAQSVEQAGRVLAAPVPGGSAAAGQVGVGPHGLWGSARLKVEEDEDDSQGNCMGRACSSIFVFFSITISSQGPSAGPYKESQGRVYVASTLCTFALSVFHLSISEFSRCSSDISERLVV
jgi:hypothetical protein